MKPGWKVIVRETKEDSKTEPVKTGTPKTWGWRRTGRQWTWRSWRIWGEELLRGGAQGVPAVEWSPAGHTTGRPATNSRTTTSLLTLFTTQTQRMRLSMVMGFLPKCSIYDFDFSRTTSRRIILRHLMQLCGLSREQVNMKVKQLTTCHLEWDVS